MSAILSPCGLYRYRLERQIAMEGPVYAFFGINPSTADASVDDATVRKWTGFCKRWGAARYIVGNVFAYRATDVTELAAAANPSGLVNAPHLLDIVRDADILVPCWGNRTKVPKSLQPRLDDVLHMLLASGKPVMHFGLTNSGDPKHPLMLGYDTQLAEWPQEGGA